MLCLPTTILPLAVEWGGTEFDSICSTIEEAQQVIIDESKKELAKDVIVVKIWGP